MELRTTFFRLFLGACLLLCLTALPTLAQVIRYVKPVATGTGTGDSWANASGDLQAMINAGGFSSNEQIWVMAGTYKPTTGGHPTGGFTPTPSRNFRFILRNGVAIYGGFLGTETALSQRPAMSVTVPSGTTLSGDIGTPNNTADNTVTLIDVPGSLFSPPTIDGFVLTACNSTSTVSGGSLNGAIRNASGPTIRNCWFINNTNEQNGGAIANSFDSGDNLIIQNCRFESNTAVQGGAIYTSGGSDFYSIRVLNSVFVSNTASQGGAIASVVSSYGGFSNAFTNCSFQSNVSTYMSSAFGGGTLSGGGVMYSELTSGSTGSISPVFTNCSFQGNRISSVNAAFTGYGALLFNRNLGSGSINTTLVNCVLFGNPGSTTFYQIGSSGFGNTFIPSSSYSLGESSVINTFGIGNLGATTNPFSSTNSTQLRDCSPAIDAGNNSAVNGDVSPFIPITTDLAGNPRISGGRVDMGAYETGSIQGGAIAGPVRVPFPQESPNTLASLTAASAPSAFSITWQQSGDNGAFWTDISNSNSQSILLPNNLTTDGGPNKTYQFRRIITSACGPTATAGPVSVNVVRADGRFTGQVVSTDGITPVAGVTITAVRTTTGLAGSPGSWTYTAVTGADGTYTIAPVYYGVPSGTTPASLTAATFTVTPSYAEPSSPTLTHTFSPASSTFTMNQFNTPKTFNFTDQSTYALSGQTNQSCADCITGFIGATPQLGAVSCPVDGATIRTSRNNQLLNTTQTSFFSTPAPGKYGQFAVSVNNPGVYSLSASMAGLTFVPSSQTVNVVTDVYNITFNSPTLQTITGRVAAGCNEAVGTAVLEFTDVLLDGSNVARPSCFRKRVTTNASGFYTILLPPRKYKVSVISFTPNGIAGVSSTDFLTFINGMPTDSLTRDLTSATAVTTFNLTYQRPPTVVIRGLISPPGCGTAAGYSLMQQEIPSSLTVLAYQGPVATGCPVSSGSVTISTNLQTGASQSLTNTVVGGSRSLTLIPGSPNIIAPYFRNLNVLFTDAFGRVATPLNQNVVVTGIQAGSATFETISPEIPFLVLHDPAGDASSSFWESNTTQERAMRFYTAGGGSAKTWFEAKVGVAFTVGFGYYTSVDIWGTIGGGITTSARTTNSNEAIVRTTTTQRVATSSGASITGPDADVFVGAALNLWYATSTVISFDPTSCTIGSSKRLIVANKGVATQYYYTAYEIKNSVIPALGVLRDLTPADNEKRRYDNQIAVWQQVLDNNTENRKKAQFVSNKSFDGGVGEISESVTKAVSQNNTIEFGMDIDTEIAGSLGFDIAGNGYSGGVTVNMKLESGNSETNTNTQAITTGYTLKDSNIGDRFSVDVKTDPVYGTPVFDLLGGKASCPPEAAALPRDDMQLSVTNPIATNVANNAEAQFTLKIGNISQVNTDASRTVYLSLVPTSNPDGAIISINGSPYIAPLPYTVNRLGEVQVTVRVGKSGASNVFAYEGLRFQVTDACGGKALQTVELSVFFQSPCSSVSLLSPETNWVSTQANNNSVPVQIGGYTVANLTNVTLQYQPQGGTWVDGPTLTAAQLNNGPNGTATNWNTAGLLDGPYTLRLRLTCPLGGGATGTVYSNRADGIIDRVAPVRFGNTQPTNDSYQPGSNIGVSFSENLRCATITSSNVVARRSNGQGVPVSVGCFGNQISVVPSGSWASFVGDAISLTLTGVADQYGNTKATPDVWQFSVGSQTAATGSTALSLAVVNSPLSENSTNAMSVVFRLPTVAANNVLVNFGVSGTAQFGVDYLTAYGASASQPLSATVNGAGGSILIPAGASSATLLIATINETLNEPDETIIINLLAGGDYLIGAPSAVTAVILNDDPACTGTITTVKDGSWNDPTVWSCGVVPASTDIVQLNHIVSVTTNYVAQVRTVRYGAGGRLVYQSGGRVRLGF
jgi:predicted outer membrane repeat protein